jgi:hypothetical protein
MNSPCNALARACPPITAPIIVHPISTIPHFSPMNVGDHVPDSFLSYLLDEEEENSLASHVEETRALKLGFFKKDVVGKEEQVG